MEKRLGLSVPLEGVPLQEHAEIAQAAAVLGYADAWSLEVDGIDVFSPLASVALSTGMRVGTAVANVFTRGPGILAMSAAGMAELAPGRFCLGIGSSSRTIVGDWNGSDFVRPVTRVREMVEFLRSAFTGERVVFQGETLSVIGFKLSRPPTNPIPIHVAALREGMLRTAGSVADGVIINWLSVEDVSRSVAVVRKAAVESGRDPDSVEITARLMISADPPSPESDTFLRRHIAAYLTVPVYRAYHSWLGRSDALSPMWEAWDSGDRKAAIAAIPENVIDDLIVRGSARELREHVNQYLQAGVDSASLRLLTHETDVVRTREVQMQTLQQLAPR